MALTPKQEGFVLSLVEGKSQREAYKLNYDCKIMSDKIIDETACRLLAKDKVNARYKELMGALREKAQEEGLLTATDVLRKVVELIERNENVDDKTALDGLKTYAKRFQLFNDKIELDAKLEMPSIMYKKHE